MIACINCGQYPATHDAWCDNCGPKPTAPGPGSPVVVHGFLDGFRLSKLAHDVANEYAGKHNKSSGTEQLVYGELCDAFRQFARDIDFMAKHHGTSLAPVKKAENGAGCAVGSSDERMQ